MSLAEGELAQGRPAGTAADRPVIEVRGVVKSFGSRRVLDGVDLTVHAGETLVILGASGSGKSTLLRLLLGLEQPDSGSIRVGGVELAAAEADPEALAALRRGIGVAFQGGALFGSMTVGENVELPLVEHTRLPASTRRIVARMKLALVGLEHAADLHPAQLSGGMRKRAALARALALDPELLFFDEPSAGLDPVTAAGLDRLLLRLREVFGVTLVVVTHELESAFAVADQIALMHRGRFLLTGPPEAVRSSHDPVVRRFLDRRPAEEAASGEWFQGLLAEVQPSHGG